MPLMTLKLETGGPVVPIVIGVSAPRLSALQASGQTPPGPIHVRGLIDTGASGTAVDPSVVQSLQLQPTGTVEIVTPSTGTTPHQCNQYDVAIGISMPHGIQTMQVVVPVIESSLSNQGIHALIGRDVLEKCMLIYNGAEGYFILGM